MQKKKNLNILIAGILIIIALFAGFYMSFQRMAIEADSHQSEIVMDWAQITDRAQNENVSNEEILSAFAPHITGILVKEPTVYDLSNAGRAVIMGGDELQLQVLQGSTLAPDEVKKNWRYILFYDESDALRVMAGIVTKEKTALAELHYIDDCYMLATNLTKNELTGVGIGFDLEAIELAQKYGLGIAVQVRKFDNLSPENIMASVKVIEGSRIIAIGFNDSAVPGADLDTATWVMCKEAWANALHSLNAPLMTVEFFNQKGIESLAQLMSPNVVRLHSVSEAEMAKTEIVEGVPQRFQLATSERNIKIAFVRMIPNTMLDESVELVKDIRTEIEAKGTTVGAVNLPDKLQVPTVIMLLLIAGVCAGGYLLGLKFRFGKFALILAALAFLGGAGLIFIGRVALVQKLFALCSVLIFPTLSILIFQPERGLSLGKALLRILYTCLFSLIGAVLMIGLLADNLYMLKIDAFMGVKIAHLIPVLLVLGFWFFLKDQQISPFKKIRNVLEYKVSIGFALIACAAMAVLAIYLSRTGNESAAVSGAEKWLRLFLDDVLYVRPRTKEFLIGYPCLLFMYYYGYRDWFLPIMAFAVIGQVSLVNTYAHIHTPIVYSLLRSLNGLWLGIVIALLMLGALKIFISLYEKNKQKLQQLFE